jgi:hypothetical protein
MEWPALRFYLCQCRDLQVNLEAGYLPSKGIALHADIHQTQQRLLAVGVGPPPGQTPLVELDPLAVPARIGLRDRLRVPVTGRVLGSAGAPVVVDLLWDGEAVSHVDVPILFSYDADRGDAEWSAVLGLVSYKSTIAAWELRLLWLVKFGGGDADRLVEVKQ